MFLRVDVRADLAKDGLLPSHKLAWIRHIEEVDLHLGLHGGLPPHLKRLAPFFQLQFLQVKKIQKSSSSSSLRDETKLSLSA